ncbi:hypothetical protein GCM10028805_36550 [Spirosoma harenae]
MSFPFCTNNYSSEEARRLFVESTRYYYSADIAKAEPIFKYFSSEEAAERSWQESKQRWQNVVDKAGKQLLLVKIRN